MPNDQAFATFGDENPDLNNDTTALRALLEYHIANGTHPSATFGLEPLFVPTLLTDPNYTNVTGGQVVEFASMNSQPTVVSGVRAQSHVIEPVRLSFHTILAILTVAGHLLPRRPHSDNRLRPNHTNLIPGNRNQSRTDGFGGFTQQGWILNTQQSGCDDSEFVSGSYSVWRKFHPVLSELYRMGRTFERGTLVYLPIQHIPRNRSLLFGIQEQHENPNLGGNLRHNARIRRTILRRRRTHHDKRLSCLKWSTTGT